jgi:Domain of unknown function (DUF1906)
VTRVVVAAPACRIVDADVKLTAALLDAIQADGSEGVARYVPLPGNNPAGDIDAPELDLVLDHAARFGSFFVQHPRYPGWRPRECDPEADAMWAVKFAVAAGYQPGTTGFVDAEGMSLDTTAPEAFVYNARWTHVLVEEGFRAGVYDGYSTPLTPAGLYEIPDATCYWSDAANRKVAVRGTAIVQGPGFKLLGVPLDPDRIAPDLLGGTPWWTIAE